MIESSDAVKVIETVANTRQNFQRLPDIFWGYFARGRDRENRKYGVIITYSEKKDEFTKLTLQMPYK